MYKLITELSGDVLCRGTKAECELALQALVRYGIRSDKFEIVEA